MALSTKGASCCKFSEVSVHALACGAAVLHGFILSKNK